MLIPQGNPLGNFYAARNLKSKDAKPSNFTPAVTITHKMLTAQLKELEKDGLVLRKEYPLVPPRVEYSLSQMGRDLRPVVESMHNWISSYSI